MAGKKKSIKIGAVILLFMFIIGTLYGLYSIFFAESTAKSNFSLYTGKSWSEVIISNPKLAHLYREMIRLAGGIGFALQIAGLFIVIAAFRKGEKWAWFCILFMALIGWISVLAHDIFLKDINFIIVDSVGIGLLILGLVIPAKAILRKQKVD
jgi:hypothetical protein